MNSGAGIDKISLQEDEESNIETYSIHENCDSYGKIIYKEESYLIQGAIFEVYKVMGCGFLESVYQECLCKEF